MWCDKIMIKWTETLDYMFNVLQMIDPVPVCALLLYWQLGKSTARIYENVYWNHSSRPVKLPSYAMDLHFI